MGSEKVIDKLLMFIILYLIQLHIVKYIWQPKLLFGRKLHNIENNVSVTPQYIYENIKIWRDQNNIKLYN